MKNYVNWAILAPGRIANSMAAAMNGIKDGKLETIDGKFAMLSRPSDSGHTPFGDILLSYSPDMKYWGEHRLVM